MELYPIIFEPILQDRIWGGTKLRDYLGKTNLPSDTTGESWELSAVEGNISVVKNGAYAGLELTEILKEHPAGILGSKVHEKFGVQFPLLFKFLDASKDLSIQVHPNDELAKKRHNAMGKTEMWYVMQADPGARIIAGFKEDGTPGQYLEHLKDNSILSILNSVPATKGDAFFLATGTIHALGAGIVVAEIQQTSDITYRVYDWDRTDAEGKKRELHIEQAIDAINYKAADTKKQYEKNGNEYNTIVASQYFTTTYLPLNGAVEVNKDGSSFTVYICTEGAFTVEYSGETASFKLGDTILIPAAMKNFTLKGKAALLEIYI